MMAGEKSNEKETESFGEVQESLERLASVREQMGGWLDSEVEEEEQSCVFKMMESLEPFFLANYLFPTDFARLTINEELLLGDINQIVDIIDKEGFSASPYLFIREVEEFVDSASLALRLMIMIRQYIKKTVLKDKTEWSGLSAKVSKIAERACDFILSNSSKSKGSRSWAGSVLTTHKKTSYCNVYFTSEAIRSLAFLNRHKNLFSTVDNKKIEEAVAEGCRWVLGRVRDNTVFGDDAKTRGEINYTFYGLNGLLDCFEYLEERQKTSVLNVFKKFLDRVSKGDEGLTWLRTIDVPLKSQPRPIYYEDRASAGNVVTVLCKGRNTFREYTVIDERFFKILGSWYRTLVSDRNPDTQLWDKSDFLICYTVRAIESLLYFAQYGKVVTYEFSEQEVLKALKNTLENTQIQQLFLVEIGKVKRSEREDLE